MDITGSKAVLEAVASWKEDVSGSSRRMALSQRAISGELSPTFPEVSSVSVIFETDSPLDIAGIHGMLSGCKEMALESGHEVSLKLGKSPERAFRNQTTLSYTSPGDREGVRLKRSVMLFGRGTIHVAGSRSISDAAQSAHNVLNSVVASGARVPPNLEVKRIKIALINSDFRLGVNVLLTQLAKVASETYGTVVSYDPDVHPSVTIRFRGVTIMVFTTGSVIVTGSKTMLGVAEAFAFIVGIIAEHRSEVVSEVPGPVSKRPPRKSKRSYLEFAAHGSSELEICGVPRLVGPRR